MSNYVQKGSISVADGLLESSNRRASLVDFPVEYGKNNLIMNDLDIVSNKRISFWKEDGTLSRILTVVNITNYLLTANEGESKANVTLISLYGENNFDKLSEIVIVDIDSDTDMYIQNQ